MPRGGDFSCRDRGRVFYQPVAEHPIPIRHALESSRKFRTRFIFLQGITTWQGQKKHTINAARLQSDFLVFTVLERSSDEQNLGLLFIRLVLAGLGRTAEHTVGDHNQDVEHAENDTDAAS